MIHEIQVKIPVEAPTREEACRLLTPFLENPRNPNLLPRSALHLSFYFSYDGFRAAELAAAPKTKYRFVGDFHYGQSSYDWSKGSYDWDDTTW